MFPWRTLPLDVQLLAVWTICWEASSDFDDRSLRLRSGRRQAQPLCRNFSVLVLMDGSWVIRAAKSVKSRVLSWPFSWRLRISSTSQGLVRQGVVGEGGDPGSAGVVDWVRSVTVEGCIECSRSSCGSEVPAQRGQLVVDRFLLDRSGLLGELTEMCAAGLELANRVGLDLQTVQFGERAFLGCRAEVRVDGADRGRPEPRWVG